MRHVLRKIWLVGSKFILGIFVLGVGVLATYFGSKYSNAKEAPTTNPETEQKPDAIFRSSTNAVVVPTETAKRLGLSTQTLSESSQRCPTISFIGILAFDNDSLSRIHSRFSGELVSIGQTDDGRPLRLGDQVKAGQLLAVVWSKDLGEKKSELCDAVSKLTADTTTFQRLENLYKNGGVPERSVLEAERVVQADKIAVDRAERTLKTWRLSDSEIASIKEEANRISTPKSSGVSHSSDWAKVEVRSMIDGTVVEKSCNQGDIVDTTNTLFTVSSLTELAVWAHVYEEDLALLNSLPKPIKWTITIPSQPDHVSLGQLEHMSTVIDPNQHTALAFGHVQNPNQALKIGQTVKVSVSLPRSSNEIELPADSVIEDGRESIVFIRSGDSKPEYIRSSVRVTRRFRDVIYVQADPERIRNGTAIVTSGALLLRDAVDQLPPLTVRQ